MKELEDEKRERESLPFLAGYQWVEGSPCFSFSLLPEQQEDQRSQPGQGERIL